MTVDIEGASFDLFVSSSDQIKLLVTSRSAQCTAVEFIVESTDETWASSVLPLRPWLEIEIPGSVAHHFLQIRLFDELGRELAKGEKFLVGLQGARAFARDKLWRLGVARAVAVIAAVCSVGYLWKNLDTFFSSGAQARVPSESVSPQLALAVLSRGANLRLAPELQKDNIITTLPFGTQLSLLSQSGDFLEVQVFGGRKGYVHKNVAGDARRVMDLGSGDALENARGVKDDRRAQILDAGRAVRQYVVTAAAFPEAEARKIDSDFQAAIAQTSGDDVSGRFFHYLAEDAAAHRNYQDARVYFRAAALAAPAAVEDVHGWGISQMREAGVVDEDAVLHAVVVAPRGANTWLMVAGYLASGNGSADSDAVSRALRLAAQFSTDKSVTKKFLLELLKHTSNERLKASLSEVTKAL